MRCADCGKPVHLAHRCGECEIPVYAHDRLLDFMLCQGAGPHVKGVNA